MAINFRIPMMGGVQVAGSSACGLRDWKITYESNSIACRPTPKNLMWRCGAILAVLLILVPMSMSFGPPWNPITRAERIAAIPPAVTDEQLQEIAEMQAANRPMDRDILGDEKMAEIEKKVQADQAKRKAERAQRDGRTDLIGIALLGVYWVVFLLLVGLGWLFGLLPVIRFPFECVRIERSGDDLVMTRSRVFGRAVRRTAITELSHLSWGVRKQGGTIHSPARWVWYAVGVTGSSPSQLSHWPLIEFELEAESSEPDDYAKPPEHTRLFLKALSALTGLAIVQPTVERRSSSRAKMRYNATSI